MVGGWVEAGFKILSKDHNIDSDDVFIEYILDVDCWEPNCESPLRGLLIQYNHLYTTTLHPTVPHPTSQKVKLQVLLGTFDAAIGNLFIYLSICF